MGGAYFELLKGQLDVVFAVATGPRNVTMRKQDRLPYDPLAGEAQQRIFARAGWAHHVDQTAIHCCSTPSV